MPVPGLGHVAPVPVVCFTETSQFAFSGNFDKSPWCRNVLGVQFFYSSLKNTAGEPRFQQAVAEIYEVTLDFDNVCIMDECAKRAHFRHNLCRNCRGRRVRKPEEG